MKLISRKDIKRLYNKDEKTFIKIYNIYKNRIYIYVNKFVKRKDHRDKIIYECFKKIIETCANFDYNIGNFDRFVFLMTRLVLTDYFRKESKLQFIQYEYLEYEELDDIEDYNDIQNEEFYDLVDELEMFLSNEEFNVYVYRNIYLFNFYDICSELNMSKYEVRKYYKDANKKVMEFLKVYNKSKNE